MEWQTGAYERHADFRFILPFQFLLLCKLMDTTPQEVLADFMDNLSCCSWNREGRDNARAKLIDYFIAHGYGQQHYTVEDIHSIFKEMDAMGLLWPANAEMKLLDLSVQWREAYHAWWFEKWCKKPVRKLT